METFTPIVVDPEDVSEKFEPGLCYHVTFDDNAGWMIFRHGGSAVGRNLPGKVSDGRDNHRCFTGMLLSSGSGGKPYTEDTKPWVTERKCRRATVEEEIWYDECVRAKGFLAKEEALEAFEKRYEI